MGMALGNVVIDAVLSLSERSRWTQVWESSRIVSGVVECLGLVRLFPVITDRAEVTDGQLKAAYISRWVWFGL